MKNRVSLLYNFPYAIRLIGFIIMVSSFFLIFLYPFPINFLLFLLSIIGAILLFIKKGLSIDLKTQQVFKTTTIIEKKISLNKINEPVQQVLITKLTTLILQKQM